MKYNYINHENIGTHNLFCTFQIEVAWGAILSNGTFLKRLGEFFFGSWKAAANIWRCSRRPITKRFGFVHDYNTLDHFVVWNQSQDGPDENISTFFAGTS